MADGSPPDDISLCIGCGRDHPRGAGCGYARPVTWTRYAREERFKHLRPFPVVASLAAAAIAVFFLVRPPDNPLYLYVGVALPALIALALGIPGGITFVRELRKRRYRVHSDDGRDRALVVLIGGEVYYAFGESLIYQPTADLSAFADLSCDAALALGDRLPTLLDEDLAEWVREDAQNDTLLQDPESPEARLALVVMATVLGMAARDEVSLHVGRYKGWGRGGGKMESVTHGVEVALDGHPEQPPEGALERAIAELAAPRSDGPAPLDAILDTLADGRSSAKWFEALSEGRAPGDTAPETTAATLAKAQSDEMELCMRLLQHALPGRPRTIGHVAER